MRKSLHVTHTASAISCRKIRYVIKESDDRDPCLLNRAHSGDFLKYLNAFCFRVTQSKRQGTVILRNVNNLLEVEMM